MNSPVQEKWHEATFLALGQRPNRKPCWGNPPWMADSPNMQQRRAGRLSGEGISQVLK
jgi:hypothetical protein